MADQLPGTGEPPSEHGMGPGMPRHGSTTAADVTPGLDRKGRVRRTRTSGVWIGLILSAVFLILLIVFIAQNSNEATVHFLGWSGQFPLWLTILFAAIAGMLLVAVPGTVRILQLRRSVRKQGPSGAMGK